MTGAIVEANRASVDGATPSYVSANWTDATQNSQIWKKLFRFISQKLFKKGHN
jgi:hypothetical protein